MRRGVGTEHTSHLEPKHINVQTRIERLVRRTMGCATTTTLHDLVLGLCITREEVGQPSHPGAPAVHHLPQRDEGSDGDAALVPEAPVSMPDDQERDAGHQAQKDQAAHRKV